MLMPRDFISMRFNISSVSSCLATWARLPPLRCNFKKAMRCWISLLVMALPETMTLTSEPAPAANAGAATVPSVVRQTAALSMEAKRGLAIIIFLSRFLPVDERQSLPDISHHGHCRYPAEQKSYQRLIISCLYR